MSTLPSWISSSAAARLSLPHRETITAVAPVRPGPAAIRAGGPALRIEVLDHVGAARHRDAWADLQTRALEDNVFLDPGFALPAAQHLAAFGRITFVLVWAAGEAARGDLLAVVPLVRSRHPFQRAMPVWFHDMAARGIPLIDRTRGRDALRAVLDWVRRRFPRCRALVFRAVPCEGPTAALIAEMAADGRATAVLTAWERAVLCRDAGEMRSGLGALGRKGAKEARRQRRRLADCGTLVFDSARADDDLRLAAERFLALEARGWKGHAGTALLANPGQTAFFRAMTRLLGQDGRCRIDSLTLDGVPLAMGVVITAGDTDFFWKTAYAEEAGALSPGVQFVLDLSAAQLDGHARTTDSCAVPNHPMIDRLWRDRMAMCDVAVATVPGRSVGFRSVVARERLVRLAKGWAKRAASAVRGWRGSRSSRSSGDAPSAG